MQKFSNKKRILPNKKNSHKSLSHASHMWNTCLGYFSHSSGNPLTCGSSISFESIFSAAPFSNGLEEPEIICLTRVWFKSTWKSAEIFLPSLTSYSATLTKKGSTWRKYQKYSDNWEDGSQSCNGFLQLEKKKVNKYYLQIMIYISNTCFPPCDFRGF